MVLEPTDEYEELRQRVGMLEARLEARAKRKRGITKLDVARFLLVVLFAVLTIANLSYTFYAWDNIIGVEKPSGYGINQLLILYPVFVEYALISLFACSAVALHKGGWNKLKPISEDGLILGLILGLIAGLILGLVWGLILGLILSLIGGLILGSIVGLIIEYN